MHIGLIPLDERPVNTRYPAMIATIAGATVNLPPLEALSTGRRPAATEALTNWLNASIADLDGLIVSCEMLGYGGLVASRIGHEPLHTILERLDTLRTIRRRYPHMPIYGFNVVTRVSNADDAIEEPDYWAEYGTACYNLSQLLHRRQCGESVATQIVALEQQIPAAYRHDFILRRLRNHSVNLAILQMYAAGVFDLLVLSSDDTSPFGLPSREKRWIEEWADLLNNAAHRDPGTEAPATQETQASSDIPHPASLLMYPGADEVGCVLLARMLNQADGIAPQVSVSYAPPAGAANVAAYEDTPIQVTVERQLAAAGCVLAQPADSAAIWLGVNTPVARRSEWAPEYAAAEAGARDTDRAALIHELAQQHAAGHLTALADVAYPNGADPALVDRLRNPTTLVQLTAYSAWNTAGNSIGTSVAHACAVHRNGTAGRAAGERFLVHRLIEDWGYQQRVRAEVRSWLQEAHGVREPNTPELLKLTTARIEIGLSAALAELPGYAARYHITPGSVRLPWGRTFEVDFDLEDLQTNPS